MDVEQISQTKEQCIISRDNCEDAYILKDYRAGRECSTDSIDDMRGGSRALAQLHNILEKYPLPSDIEVESLHEKAQRKCAQIVKLKTTYCVAARQMPLNICFMNAMRDS